MPVAAANALPHRGGLPVRGIPSPTSFTRVLIPCLRPSALLSLAAGTLTPFTISLGGEMPLGELLLFVAAGWALLIAALAHAWPGDLWKSPAFLGFMLCQAAALTAYVASDLVRGSAPHDYIRGWARMVFLAVDLAAVAYLAGCSARNLLLLVVGVQIGEIAKVMFDGALFGDVWKFGYALPVTVAVLLVAGRMGVCASICAGVALGVLHFHLDFRSLGMLCLIVAACVGVQWFPRHLRGWIAPIGLGCGLALGAWVYSQTRNDREGQRSTRSDVERSAMVIAALEAFRESPLIGNGSWFSRTRVMDNFMVIREERAKTAGVGGFAGANEIEDDIIALHSQILVTLAEGGIFGASFFIPYAFALCWALHRQVVGRDWSPAAPIRCFILCVALFHAFLSPFSGAHRVGIAFATILVVLIYREERRDPVNEDEDGADAAPADPPRLNRPARV